MYLFYCTLSGGTSQGRDEKDRSPAQITRLKRNESVSTHTIEVFCRILACRVEDIMEYIPERK